MPLHALEKTLSFLKADEERSAIAKRGVLDQSHPQIQGLFNKLKAFNVVTKGEFETQMRHVFDRSLKMDLAVISEPEAKFIEEVVNDTPMMQKSYRILDYVQRSVSQAIADEYSRNLVLREIVKSLNDLKMATMRTAWEHVAKRIEQCDKLRAHNLWLNSTMNEMRADYLKDVQQLRDDYRLRTDPEAGITDNVDIVQLYDPYRYLDAETQSHVFNVVKEKLKMIYEFNPALINCVNVAQVAKMKAIFEESLTDELKATLQAKCQENEEIKFKLRNAELEVKKIKREIKKAEATGGSRDQLNMILQHELDGMKAEVEQLKGNIGNAQKQQARAEERYQDAMKQVATIQASSSTLSIENDDLKQEVGALMEEKNFLSQEVRSLRSKNASLQRQLSGARMEHTTILVEEEANIVRSPNAVKKLAMEAGLEVLSKEELDALRRAEAQSAHAPASASKAPPHPVPPHSTRNRKPSTTSDKDRTSQAPKLPGPSEITGDTQEKVAVDIVGMVAEATAGTGAEETISPEALQTKLPGPSEITGDTQEKAAVDIVGMVAEATGGTGAEETISPEALQDVLKQLAAAKKEILRLQRENSAGLESAAAWEDNNAALHELADEQFKQLVSLPAAFAADAADNTLYSAQNLDALVEMVETNSFKGEVLHEDSIQMELRRTNNELESRQAEMQAEKRQLDVLSTMDRSDSQRKQGFRKSQEKILLLFQSIGQLRKEKGSLEVKQLVAQLQRLQTDALHEDPQSLLQHEGGSWPQQSQATPLQHVAGLPQQKSGEFLKFVPQQRAGALPKLNGEGGIRNTEFTERLQRESLSESSSQLPSAMLPPDAVGLPRHQPGALPKLGGADGVNANAGNAALQHELASPKHESDVQSNWHALQKATLTVYRQVCADLSAKLMAALQDNQKLQESYDKTQASIKSIKQTLESGGSTARAIQEIEHVERATMLNRLNTAFGATGSSDNTFHEGLDSFRRGQKKAMDQYNHVMEIAFEQQERLDHYANRSSVDGCGHVNTKQNSTGRPHGIDLTDEDAEILIVNGTSLTMEGSSQATGPADLSTRNHTLPASSMSLTGDESGVSLRIESLSLPNGGVKGDASHIDTVPEDGRSSPASGQNQSRPSKRKAQSRITNTHQKPKPSLDSDYVLSGSAFGDTAPEGVSTRSSKAPSATSKGHGVTGLPRVQGSQARDVDAQPSTDRTSAVKLPSVETRQKAEETPDLTTSGRRITHA